MNNFIKEWSWEKPTEEGDYLVCYGDVETPENVTFSRLRADLCGDLIERENVDGGFYGRPVSDYGKSYKFAKLIYRPSEIKEREL